MQIIQIENNDKFAKIQDDGVDGEWSVYLMDGDPEYTKESSRAARGFSSETLALHWAHLNITK